MRVAIFDIEGVIIDGEFLPELAKLVGKEKEVREITLKGIRGEIFWEDGLKKRIELLKGIEYEKCVEIAHSLPFMKGAKEMSEMLRSMGFILIGVSGGFSLLADRVKEELKFDHVFSNQLVFHNNRLIGYGLLVSSNKARILETALGDVLYESKKIAVVDGANDIDLFGIADLRVAFNAQPAVAAKADVKIKEKDLNLVVEAIRKNGFAK